MDTDSHRIVILAIPCSLKIPCVFPGRLCQIKAVLALKGLFLWDILIDTGGNDFGDKYLGDK